VREFYKGFKYVFDFFLNSQWCKAMLYFMLYNTHVIIIMIILKMTKDGYILRHCFF